MPEIGQKMSNDVKNYKNNDDIILPLIISFIFQELGIVADLTPSNEDPTSEIETVSQSDVRVVANTPSPPRRYIFSILY